jgi:hypothetical protein
LTCSMWERTIALSSTGRAQRLAFRSTISRDMYCNARLGCDDCAPPVGEKFPRKKRTDVW